MSEYVYDIVNAPCFQLDFICYVILDKSVFLFTGNRIPYDRINSFFSYTTCYLSTAFFFSCSTNIYFSLYTSFFSEKELFSVGRQHQSGVKPEM